MIKIRKLKILKLQYENVLHQKNKNFFNVIFICSIFEGKKNLINSKFLSNFIIPIYSYVPKYIYLYYLIIYFQYMDKYKEKNDIHHMLKVNNF